MTPSKDYYDILGVDKSASETQVKSAYRKKALEWHPDRHKGADKEEAEKKFKEINEAYQVLSDSQKRQAYDQFGSDAFAPGGGFKGGSPFGGGFGGQGGPFTYTWTSTGGQSPFTGFDFGDPFDIFESFFQSGSPFSSQTRRIPRYSVKIDFMEAVKGTMKEINIEGKKKKIKIPPGVDEGTKINFGDFVLSVNVLPHNLFERDGDDIYVKIKIPFSLAVLGGEILVPTVDEEDIKIKIRPGTQSGTMIRLRDKGVSNIHHKRKGDQYVKIIITTPEKVNREQRGAIEDLRRQGL